MSDTALDVPTLQLEATIGFSGQIANGLRIHPDRQHFIYPMGCTVVIENISTGKQHFLSGHTDYVTCIAVGNTGNYLASGQVTHMGFKADIIVWEYNTRAIHCRLVLHKVKVEALAFSPNDLYIVSLGGSDDGCVVVWSVAKKEAICGSPAQPMSAGDTLCLAYGHKDENLFVTGGERTLRVWDLDVPNRKIRPTDVSIGKLKRTFTCCEISGDDEYFYCGSQSGDMIAVNIKTKLFNYVGPEKDKFSCGITAIAMLKTGETIVGTGGGIVAVVKGNKFTRVAKKLKELGSGAVTSIALRGMGHQFFVGTDLSQLYRFNYAEFSCDLLSTCHPTPVYDIAFPCGSSEIFVTCGKENIRVWNVAENKEVLRVEVPNKTCHAVNILRDGKALLSGWDDGQIRSYYPATGKFMFEIKDAHSKGVTALTSTASCKRIISGGGEGQVRVWSITQGRSSANKICFISKLEVALKEHKGAVSAIKVKLDDSECVSASSDGTCIVWDMTRFVRKQIMFANTLFRSACYHPDEMQVITSGTDRKIGYWEVTDGCLIRELDACKTGAINSLDINSCGELFTTVGEDKLVRVWRYNEGEVTHVGIGHAAPINCIKICPSSTFMISVSSDGAILRWKFPEFPQPNDNNDDNEINNAHTDAQAIEQ